MISDIILENAAQGQRLIIDTKFTSVFGRSQHRHEMRFVTVDLKLPAAEIVLRLRKIIPSVAIQ